MRRSRWRANAKKIYLHARKPVALALSTATLTFFLGQADLGFLEARSYDFRQRFGFHPNPDPNIVLVGIDDESIRRLKEVRPLNLKLHTRLLERLADLQPQAVGYLIDLTQASDLTTGGPDAVRSAEDEFLAGARRVESKGIPFLIGTELNVLGESLPPGPLSALPHALSLIHKDGNIFGEDKVTRRALSYLYDQPLFHVELATRLDRMVYGKLPRGSFYVPEADGHYFFFRYHGRSSYLPGDSHAGGYRYLSFADLAEGRVAPEEIRGKILLVSTVSREDSGDFVLTPYSRMPLTSPKLVAHANILDSVLHDQGLVLAPDWVNALVTFSLVTLVLGWIVASTPLQGLVATLGLSLGYVLLTHLLFQLAGVWVRVAEPLAGIFVVYYLVVPYRLIMEYRKRWEYQRRNVLLLQVEELKSNFLSLVTHDLKTPVARIQGLAEVLLRKAADRLVDRDRETLHDIIDSTDELNRFITSILDLSKIESSRLNLNLEQKDVNQLIERAIEQFKPQARAQNKRIVAQLDPLFPIRLDASLISKVINNLIDNALKYSPAGSTVTVSSRETPEWVEIAVHDQGIGLSAEDKRRLFTRFFRAQNETTMKVKGTGLGLYVTKYFIEAHCGRVELESERGKGSVFKILLPLQMPDRFDGAATESIEPANGARPGLLVALQKILKQKKEKA